GIGHLGWLKLAPRAAKPSSQRRGHPIWANGTGIARAERSARPRVLGEQGGILHEQTATQATAARPAQTAAGTVRSPLAGRARAGPFGAAGASVPGCPAGSGRYGLLPLG